MLSEKIQLWNDADNVTLQAYVLHNSSEFRKDRKRPAVIVCPGGGYLGTSDREAEPVALRFAAQGYHAFVLRYTTYYREFVDVRNPSPGNPGSAYPQPMFDLAKAILTIRDNAETYHVDPDKIIVCGFSAGGHLAASLGVHWQNSLLKEKFNQDQERWKPNALILGYPILDFPVNEAQAEAQANTHIRGFMKKANQALFGCPDPTAEDLVRLSPSRHVSPLTPPTFLWHTSEDDLVYVSNSLIFASELARHGVPFDLHVFEKGCHGLSLCDDTTAGEPGHINPHAGTWVDLALSWLKLRF